MANAHLAVANRQSVIKPRALSVLAEGSDQIRPVDLLSEGRHDARCTVGNVCLPTAGQQLDLRPQAER